MSRDLGHARLESVVLCNLGMVYDDLARFDEARERFEAALVIARESGDRHGEGQFLSYLGRCTPARPISSTRAIAWIPARLCYAECPTG